MTDNATMPVGEQLTGAIEAAARVTGAALPVPGQKQRVPTGVRIQVAMMNAAGNNCACTVCRALRLEAAAMSEQVLAELDDDAGSPDNPPG